MSQKILVYAMNYNPEIAGVGRYTGEIAEFLAAQGHEVVAVTTPPHYPGWKVLAPFRNRFSKEERAGVRVVRCPLLLKEKMGGIWRLIAPASFAVASLPALVAEFIRLRPDVVICIEPTLMAAPAAALLAKLGGARSVLHVQDLEVDAAFAVGHLSGKRGLKKIGYAFERAMMGVFSAVITISDRMADHLRAKGVAPDRLHVIRNWVDLDHIYPLDDKSEYRNELGYSADDFVVLYSGNIGAKQGLPVLLDAAVMLKDEPRIKFVVAGEGPAKADLIARYGDLANVRFLPFQPYSRLNAFLNMPSLHALPQEAGAADLVLPSKLGGMLASGRPIIVTADAETEIATFLGNSAYLTPPGDATALAAGIRTAAQGGSDVDRQRQSELAGLLSRSTGLANFVETALGSRPVEPASVTVSAR